MGKQNTTAMSLRENRESCGEDCTGPNQEDGNQEDQENGKKEDQEDEDQDNIIVSEDQKKLLRVESLIDSQWQCQIADNNQDLYWHNECYYDGAKLDDNQWISCHDALSANKNVWFYSERSGEQRFYQFEEGRENKAYSLDWTEFVARKERCLLKYDYGRRRLTSTRRRRLNTLELVFKDILPPNF